MVIAGGEAIARGFSLAGRGLGMAQMQKILGLLGQMGARGNYASQF
jgi:hypothetical protein